MFRMRLVGGTGVALLAMMALCPVSRANEVEAAGQNVSLGVTVVSLSDELRERMDYRSGVLVTGVTPGGLAEQGGITKGDVLVMVGSVTLRTVGDLARAESSIEPGQAVSIVFSRDGGRLIKIIKLETSTASTQEAEDVVADRAADAVSAVAPISDTSKPQPPAAPVPPEQQSSGFMRVGVRCEDLNPDLAAALGMPTGRGALVLQVVERSPAALAGVRPGDVITRVGEQRIWGSEHLMNAMESAPTPVSIALRRQGVERRVELRLEAPADPGKRGEVKEAQVEAANEALRALREEVRMLRREVEKLRGELAEIKGSNEM